MAEGDYFRQRTDSSGNVQYVEHGDGPMRTRSEATDQGALIITMSGRPQQNEEGVHSVCVRLAEAISQRTGQLWLADPDRPAGREQGVDRYLRSGGDGLWGVQVTRVGSGSRWARSARGEQVSEEVVASVAAAEIWEAIEKKLTFRGGILA